MSAAVALDGANNTSSIRTLCAQSGCGRGDVDGDYMTPLCIFSLPGAEELVLPGVWHIPRRHHVWYGDAPVVNKWLQYLPVPQAQAAV